MGFGLCAEEHIGPAEESDTQAPPTERRAGEGALFGPADRWRLGRGQLPGQPQAHPQRTGFRCESQVAGR